MLKRFLDWLFDRHPTYRMAPPLQNAHLIGLHMSNSETRSALK